jgi:hypothetical protein
MPGYWRVKLLGPSFEWSTQLESVVPGLDKTVLEAEKRMIYFK